MRPLLCIMILLFHLSTSTSQAQESPTITVANQAGDTATVRVVGPTTGVLQLTPGTSQTVGVSGGTYHLMIRYCNSGGHCNYSKTDFFTVTQTAYAVGRITVRLHSAAGNLNERTSSASEFDAGQ